MTPWELAGCIPVVAGAIHALGAVWHQPWAVGLRGRWGRRESDRGVGRPAVSPACERRVPVVIRYEPPDGGQLTVWVIATAPEGESRGEGFGPW
jgi:hypothetical protein